MKWAAPSGLIAVAMLAGCGGMPRCAQRVGTVQVYMTARDGNCPSPVISRTTVTTQPTSVPPGCTGTLTESADNCEVTQDAVCPGNDGTTSHVSGTVSWDDQGTKGSGVILMTLQNSGNGAIVCQSSYDAVYTKL